MNEIGSRWYCFNNENKSIELFSITENRITDKI